MDAFVKAATSGRRSRADALYDETGTDPWVRLVKGQGWEGDPGAPGGPNGWAPLLYVTHSLYAVDARAGRRPARRLPKPASARRWLNLRGLRRRGT